MLYRERCVISNEIVICSINNRLKTLKYCNVEDSYPRDIENFNRLTHGQSDFLEILVTQRRTIYLK